MGVDDRGWPPSHPRLKPSGRPLPAAPAGPQETPQTPAPRGAVGASAPGALRGRLRLRPTPPGRGQQSPATPGTSGWVLGVGKESRVQELCRVVGWRTGPPPLGPLLSPAVTQGWQYLSLGIAGRPTSGQALPVCPLLLPPPGAREALRGCPGLGCPLAAEVGIALSAVRSLGGPIRLGGEGVLFFEVGNLEILDKHKSHHPERTFAVCYLSPSPACLELRVILRRGAVARVGEGCWGAGRVTGRSSVPPAHRGPSAPRQRKTRTSGGGGARRPSGWRRMDTRHGSSLRPGPGVREGGADGSCRRLSALFLLLRCSLDTEGLWGVLTHILPVPSSPVPGLASPAPRGQSAHLCPGRAAEALQTPAAAVPGGLGPGSGPRLQKGRAGP